MTYYNSKINHYHYFNSELSAYQIKTEIIRLEPRLNPLIFYIYMYCTCISLMQFVTGDTN